MADLGPEGTRRILLRSARLEAGEAPQRLGGAILLAFFEPSTRTRLGFARSALDVGAATSEIGSTRFGAGTSAPESLEDTLMVAAAYFDVIVLRHTEVPATFPDGPASIVSAGLGTDEHPTQTLVDLATVAAEIGTIEGLRWGIVGDVRGSRSAHSLLRALRWFSPAEVRIMSPAGRGASHEFIEQLHASTAGPGEVDDLDVLYVAGLPPGSGEFALDDDRRRPWRVDRRTLDRLPPTARVLCPLPRIDEIDPVVDADPRSAWFRQSARGRFVRTAVLEVCWPRSAKTEFQDDGRKTEQ